MPIFLSLNDLPKNVKYNGKSILLDTIKHEKLIELTYYFNKNFSFIEVNVTGKIIFISKYQHGAGLHYNFLDIFGNLGLDQKRCFQFPKGYENKRTNVVPATAYEACLENALFGIDKNNIWL